MEVAAKRIGNSVGVVFPAAIAPKTGQVFTIVKVEDAYILKPKRADILRMPKIGKSLETLLPLRMSNGTL